MKADLGLADPEDLKTNRAVATSLDVDRFIRL